MSDSLKHDLYLYDKFREYVCDKFLKEHEIKVFGEMGLFRDAFEDSVPAVEVIKEYNELNDIPEDLREYIDYKEYLWNKHVEDLFVVGYDETELEELRIIDNSDIESWITIKKKRMCEEQATKQDPLDSLIDLVKKMTAEEYDAWNKRYQEEVVNARAK